MRCLSLKAASVLLLAAAQRSRSKLGLVVGLTVGLGVPLLLLSLTALVGGTVLLSCRGRRSTSFQDKQSASSVLTDELQVRPLLLPKCMWHRIYLGCLLAAGQCHTTSLTTTPHHQPPLRGGRRLIFSTDQIWPCSKRGPSCLAWSSFGTRHN